MAREKAQLFKDLQELFHKWSKVEKKDAVLYRRIGSVEGGTIKYLILVPKCLQTNVLSSLHDAHGYQGMERTLQLARSRCYWPYCQYIWIMMWRNIVVNVNDMCWPSLFTPQLNFLWVACKHVDRMKFWPLILQF